MRVFQFTGKAQHFRTKGLWIVGFRYIYFQEASSKIDILHINARIFRLLPLYPTYIGYIGTSIFIQEGEITEMSLLQWIPSLFGAMSGVPIRNLGVARV